MSILESKHYDGGQTFEELLKSYDAIGRAIAQEKFARHRLTHQTRLEAHLDRLETLLANDEIRRLSPSSPAAGNCPTATSNVVVGLFPEYRPLWRDQ